MRNQRQERSDLVPDAEEWSIHPPGVDSRDISVNKQQEGEMRLMRQGQKSEENERVCRAEGGEM